MMTINRKTFEQLCSAFGKSLLAASAAIVAQSGEMLVVDNTHKDFPRSGGCGCGKSRGGKKK